MYEWYGLKKKSPTVGCFMFADDYIKFISNLKYYLSLEIEMHISKESKHFDKLVEYNSTEAPIGFLDDIEVIMLHYKDPQIAKEKWERRKKRINWDNLIIKFSYMNECTQQMLKEFDNMELDILNIKKIMFIKNPDNTLKCGVYFPGFEDSRQIINDTYFFNKYFNLDKFINEGDIERRN